MHVRPARYSFTGDAHETARRAEEGMLPIYSIAAADDEIWSFSVWDSMESAGAASALAADWVAENMERENELIEGETGELLLSTALGVTV